MPARRTPHETEPQSAVWTAWPWHPDWGGDLAAAREEIAALARALADEAPAPGAVVDLAAPRLERVEAAASSGGSQAAPANAADAPPADRRRPPRVVLLARESEAAAARAAVGEGVDVRPGLYGDVWLRDTGPVVTLTHDGPRALGFAFNGWGGKYDYPGDREVAGQIARAAELGLERLDLVAEGGALELDGEGTLITTRACVLDRARNPSLDASDAEAAFARALGAQKVLWLDEGLLNDHTDGHVDTLARFVRPGLVVCQAPSGPDDPNAKRLDAVARTLDGARDASGGPIDVARVPSPGAVVDRTGSLLPASHMNYVIANGRLIAPVYDTPSAAAAVAGLVELFPELEVVALPARAILAGGGAFHCVTCAIPAEGARA